MSVPWLKFYPVDWRGDPRLRMCSLAARGLWIDLISYMHEGEPYGHLTIDGVPPDIDGISALVGRPRSEVRKAVDELESRQVFSTTDKGIIFSRRMVKDKAKAERNYESGLDGGNPEIRRGTVPKAERVRPFKRSDAPAKTRRIFDREGGICHWCRIGLVTTIDPGQPLPPNFFHVDHVIAVCDGGTNDEDNLVAACAACNHKRARDNHPTLTSDTTDWLGSEQYRQQGLLASGSSLLASSDEPSEVQQDRSRVCGTREFVDFWAIYPHKVGKQSALKAFKKARKSVEFEPLMAGLRRYIAKTDDRPWCNPATWLNEGRWDDEPAGGQNGKGTNGQARRSAGDDFFAGIAQVAARLDRDGEMGGPADEEVPPGRINIDG